MRRHGVASSARGLVPFGHLGWVYDDRADLGAQAHGYLSDGLALGQWVEYVGDGDRAALRADLAAWGLDPERAARVTVTPVWEFYEFLDDGVTVDAVASVDTRVRATEHALGAGYSGFRAVVDAGAVSRTPRQRAAFAEFELLIDRKMAVLPVSALCAFDREAAGAGADELACLHPWTGPGTGGFRLFAGTDPATVMLAGTVGAEERERWSTVLARAWPWAPQGPVTVDAGRLEVRVPQALADLDAYIGHAGRSGPTRLRLDPDAPVTGWARGALQHVEVITVDGGPPQAPAALTGNGSTTDGAELARRLHHRERQLASLPAIEQAKGVLVAMLGVDDDEAFALLVSVSQDTNVKLREVARELVAELAGAADEPARCLVLDAVARTRGRLGGRAGR